MWNSTLAVMSPTWILHSTSQWDGRPFFTPSILSFPAWAFLSLPCLSSTCLPTVEKRLNFIILFSISLFLGQLVNQYSSFADCVLLASRWNYSSNIPCCAFVRKVCAFYNDFGYIQVFLWIRYKIINHYFFQYLCNSGSLEYSLPVASNAYYGSLGQTCLYSYSS